MLLRSFWYLSLFDSAIFLFSDSNCDSEVINFGISKGTLPECKGTNLGLSVMLPDPAVLSRKKLKTHLEKLQCSQPCELDEFYP